MTVSSGIDMAKPYEMQFQREGESFEDFRRRIMGKPRIMNILEKNETFRKFRKKPVIIQARQIDEHMMVETLEGAMAGCPGDWLIIGVKGERYFCKADIFEMTYEEIKEAE